MFDTLDDPTPSKQRGDPSRFQVFVRIAGVTAVTGALFGALYLVMLLAE